MAGVGGHRRLAASYPLAPLYQLNAIKILFVQKRTCTHVDKLHSAKIDSLNHVFCAFMRRHFFFTHTHTYPHQKYSLLSP